jgi:hypothetical protein
VDFLYLVLTCPPEPFEGLVVFPSPEKLIDGVSIFLLDATIETILYIERILFNEDPSSSVLRLLPLLFRF